VASSFRRWIALPVVKCLPRHPPTHSSIAQSLLIALRLPQSQSQPAKAGRGAQAAKPLPPSLFNDHASPEAYISLSARFQLSPQEHPLVLPLWSATVDCSTWHYSLISPSCASPVPPGSTAVRGSHVSRELLRVTTPPISMSSHRYAYPFPRFRVQRFRSREIPKPVIYPT
jgi:hypothetical protein